MDLLVPIIAFCMSSYYTHFPGNEQEDYTESSVNTVISGRQLKRILGGIIPDEDIPALKESGISEIFGPGTYTDEIVDYIRNNLKK